MSVVTYRNGVMACDSFAYAGWGNAKAGTKTKIRKLATGELIGAVSNTVGGTEALLDWYENGCGPLDPKPETFTLMIVNDKREMFIVDDTLFISGPIDSEFYAIGSGRKYALGAMAMGAGPEYACQIACDLDPFCSLPTFAISYGVPGAE